MTIVFKYSINLYSCYQYFYIYYLTERQASWKLYIEEDLPSGTEEYFNKKKTLIEKRWGIVRARSARTIPPNGTDTTFKPKYSPNSLCERQKPIRLLVNQLKKRKDIAVRKASIASVNVFKGLFAHRLCNPPVSWWQMIKV